MRAVLIKGDFTDAEFAEVVALIRRIDNARPEGLFQVLVNNPGDTIEESLRRLRVAFPELECPVCHETRPCHEAWCPAPLNKSKEN